MRYSDWEQRQMDIRSGLALDSRGDPQSRRLTPAHKAEGMWECRSCESCNDEDNETCWNCEVPRDAD